MKPIALARIILLGVLAAIGAAWGMYLYYTHAFRPAPRPAPSATASEVEIELTPSPSRVRGLSTEKSSTTP